ncbi:hypothetical protein CEXT_802551 [Caerostris extrusa]|uniref:Uncharacterized protein n=1 Tax=Caerostris extrusa TaxID=172846 RepID=A0AAV4RZD5_CAEEX|nr:hypothetical protein CEXT_802551 [Caerostris extrusa]
MCKPRKLHDFSLKQSFIYPNASSNFLTQYVRNCNPLTAVRLHMPYGTGGALARKVCFNNLQRNHLLRYNFKNRTSGSGDFGTQICATLTGRPDKCSRSPCCDDAIPDNEILVQR